MFPIQFFWSELWQSILFADRRSAGIHSVSHGNVMAEKIWGCKIGEIASSRLPDGSDLPLRQAVQRAYRELTGEDEEFCFSGWGEELDAIERDVVEGR